MSEHLCVSVQKGKSEWDKMLTSESEKKALEVLCTIFITFV